jgi:hypothetical protein
MNRAVTRVNREALAGAAWALALRLPAFGYAEVAADLKISIEQATAIVRGWVSRGWLVPVQAGNGLRSLWKVKPGTGSVVLPTLRGRTAQDNLWSAMRGLRTFTPTDLAVHSSTEVISVTTGDAQAYCRLLLAGGYLRVERKAFPARMQEAIYRLIRDSGPFPPREARVRAIIDPNSEAVTVIGSGGAA